MITCSRLAPVAVMASIGAGLDVLDGLGEQLAEQGEGGHGQGQRAGEGADAHPEDEDGHVQQRLDRAQDVEDAARDVVQPDRAAGCARSGSWPPGS